MGRRARVLLGVLAVTLAASLLLWCSNIRHDRRFVRRTSEKPEHEFVGYYGEQPELRVRLLPGSESEAEVPKVIAAAKEFAKSRGIGEPGLWPGPSGICERESGWWVKFKRKDLRVLVDGQEVIETTLPGGICVQVGKGNLSCRLIPTR